MTVKTILTEPNQLLRQVSKSVKKVGKEEQLLMNDMLETMYAANGIGLAAIQIGIPKRIIVMDLSKDGKKKEPKQIDFLIPHHRPKRLLCACKRVRACVRACSQAELIWCCSEGRQAAYQLWHISYGILVMALVMAY